MMTGVAQVYRVTAMKAGLCKQGLFILSGMALMWYINMNLFTAVIKLSALTPHTADFSFQYTQTHD